MAWAQLVAPTVVNDNAGMCLRFAQSVYGAPVKYASAWDAWNATILKHLDRNLPSVSVPLWFEHWGNYGYYANWGHVVAYFADRGQFLSSPPNGYGHTWLNSIEEVERMFNSKYVGWSEDLNGLQVAQYNQDPKPSRNGNKDMIVKLQFADGWAGIWNMTTGAYQHIDDVDEWRYWTEHLQEYMFENEAHFVRIRDKYSRVFSI